VCLSLLSTVLLIDISPVFFLSLSLANVRWRYLQRISTNQNTRTHVHTYTHTHSLTHSLTDTHTEIFFLVLVRLFEFLIVAAPAAVVVVEDRQ